MKFALDKLVPEGEVAEEKLITFKTAFDGPGIHGLANSSADV